MAAIHLEVLSRVMDGVDARGIDVDPTLAISDYCTIFPTGLPQLTAGGDIFIGHVIAFVVLHEALLAEVARERRKRISTSEMNRFLKFIDFDRASVPMSKRVKIYYMTQAATSPPTFILFTDRNVKLHFSYARFVENQIRRAFGFKGTPIWIKNRASQ